MLAVGVVELTAAAGVVLLAQVVAAFVVAETLTVFDPPAATCVALAALDAIVVVVLFRLRPFSVWRMPHSTIFREAS